MDKNELLQKVVDTSALGAPQAGGLLNTEQTNRFIDYMWDETTLTNGHVDAIRINAIEREIPRMHLGRRIARGAAEGVDTGMNANPTFSKVTVTTKKFRLDWELTTESLEDGIEGRDLDDHIARMMATQFGNDLEDVSLNGDVNSADPLLKQFDGYRKLAKAGGTWLSAAALDTSGGTESAGQADGLTIDVFNLALKNLNRQWLTRRNAFRFYTSAGLVQDFLNSLKDRETPLGDEVFFDTAGRQIDGEGGRVNVRPYGIPTIEVPLQSENYAAGGDNPDEVPGLDGYGYVELTLPDNRIWATKREIEVYREFAPKKDSFEYTVYVRHGVQWKNLNAGAHSANDGGPYVAVADVPVLSA